MAIVKSNAYGHDLNTTAKALNESVDGFGVVRLEEAIHLRKQSDLPILMMQGVYSTEAYDELKKNEIWTTLHSLAQIPLAHQYVDDLVFWIKINTGMNRLGLQLSELDKCQSFFKNSNVLMTHLACADNPSDDLNNKQFDLFHKISSSINTTNEKSIGNTGSIINFPDKDFDWVRSGIGIYGGFKGDNNLKPAMSFRSKIIEIRKLKQGDRVGYNGRVIANKAMTIAIVYAGYADGYPQSAIDTTQINVNNYLVNICGQVSMDLLSIDITQIPNCKIGDWCTFWDDNKSLEHTANQNNLISYELMTRITPRVKVIYKNS